MVAKKCKGLPLAVKVLGGALRNEEDEERWIDILESEIWELDKLGRDGVLSALKITYDSMPMELKRCFPYLSLFPKYTFFIDVTDIYDEDFGSTLVEEDASYVMHDLVHDLASYVAQDEYLCVTDIMFDLEKSKNKRRVEDSGQYLWVLDDLFWKLKCLRALDLGYTNITELPESIGSLKLLRSFLIRETGVKRLSESICNLYNLQTLNFSETYYCEVPRPIGNLTLSIRAMPNWVKWDGVEVGDFPAIDDLQICQCPKLTKFPQHLISTVKALDIKVYSGLLTLKDLHSLTHLVSYVQSQNDWKWMLSSYLPTLQHLTLESSMSSVHLYQNNLPSLKTLEILYSPKLTIIEGLNDLTSLNSLVVRECPRLKFKELLPATLEQVKLSESPLFEQGYNKQLKERQKTI
ncbi:hypothetical protein ZIOFF_063366 [Zingiber officinale]|uniref:Disease resistance R13L4/SHOC-2-like LRR domain-containing protein n=1 Tax=Zingiber officinale TaxID=94328 RepID=A0A8J5K9Q9_ZINOF|nr:hypothetical protein ZIOFF_063366 [Zingiber officinale]